MSGFPEIFTSLVARRKQQEANNIEAYEFLRQSMANGDEFPVEEVDRILRAVNVEPETLEGHVKLLGDLREQQELRAKHVETMKRLPVIQATLDKNKTDFEAHRKKMLEDDAKLREEFLNCDKTNAIVMVDRRIEEINLKLRTF